MNKTALYTTHIQGGAKMVPFGGFDMPVWYSSIKEEHLSVRKKTGIFDISHMGLLYVYGKNAFETLQNLSCNTVTKTASGKMVYSMMLNDAGGILDDIMMGVLHDGYLIVVNASNKAKISAWIQANLLPDTHLQDYNEGHSFVAIQGPEALAMVQEALHLDLSALNRFALKVYPYQGQSIQIMRTGYTGEDGCEIRCPNVLIEPLWHRLVEQGAMPCGLGARDTLRLEAGLPLYGQELSEDITPLSTRYAWEVDWAHDFIGKNSLSLLHRNPIEFVTVGLALPGRAIARPHYPIQEGGHVTSGTLSPLTQRSIAMGLVPNAYGAIGSLVHVHIRDQLVEATVVEVPFLKQ